MVDNQKTRALCASCLPKLNLPLDRGGIKRIKFGGKESYDATE